jgi:hypothetical protein
VQGSIGHDAALTNRAGNTGWWTGWVITCIGTVFLGKAGSAIAYSTAFFTVVTTVALVWAGAQAVETLRRLDALQRESHSQ